MAWRLPAKCPTCPDGAPQSRSGLRLRGSHADKAIVVVQCDRLGHPRDIIGAQGGRILTVMFPAAILDGLGSDDQHVNRSGQRLFAAQGVVVVIVEVTTYRLTPRACA